MKPDKSNVYSLDAKRAEKEEQTQQGERKWGPQHAGVVKDYDPKGK